MSPARPTTSSSRQDERGSVSIELVILLPALFAVLFLGTQAALSYHGRSLAIAAAQEGARAAAAETGREADAVDAAGSFIDDAGGKDALAGMRASVNKSATTVTVTVRGHTLSVIPGWDPLVIQSASLPVERLTAP